jgi:hypothetical protein
MLIRQIQWHTYSPIDPSSYRHPALTPSTRATTIYAPRLSLTGKVCLVDMTKVHITPLTIFCFNLAPKLFHSVQFSSYYNLSFLFLNTQVEF